MKLQTKFKNKNVLITGHTGFKGVWLSAWLNLLGAKVTGVSLDALEEPSHFSASEMQNQICDKREDIRNYPQIEKIIIDSKPDYVFHLAAQAIVRKSYDDPIETWGTNVMGTINILEALRKLKNPCNAVIITSDKCYDNVEWVWGYKETDRIGGPDPYSASKGAAELAIKSYIKSYFPIETSNVRIASSRAGNVIGGGDWAADRIIPDCVRAWSKGRTVELRKPNATRPWQHVLEPLSGYLALAIALDESQYMHGEAFNFGPPAQQNQSVLELVQNMSIYWDQVKWKDVSEIEAGPYESGLLKVNCDKALALLRWNAVMGFDDTVKMTAEWYKSYYMKDQAMSYVTNLQIQQYIMAAKESGLDWAQ